MNTVSSIHPVRVPRVVSLGGGSGQTQVIRALRRLNCELTAVVAMADDGGSTGLLRQQMGSVPPGDVRNCLVALAHDPTGAVARTFQKRLPFASNHALGNLFLTSLADEAGSFMEAIEVCERILACVGRVVPSTLDKVVLRGKTLDGRIICGEDLIGHGPCTLGRAWIDTAAQMACFEAIKAIKQADLVVLGPGSLFTSIIPNLLVPGILEALRTTTAFKLFVCPKADEQYESWGLAADEYVQALASHGLAGCIDAVLLHKTKERVGAATVSFRALTQEQITAHAVGLSAQHLQEDSAYRVASSMDYKPVCVDAAIVERIEAQVPTVVVRDFDMPGMPCVHDPDKLADALCGVCPIPLEKR